MKKLTMSLVASTLLSGALYAGASSLSEAFEKGKASGEIAVYTKATSNSGGVADSGFTIGTTALNYETDSFNGFKASLGFMANTLLNEKNDGNDATKLDADGNAANDYDNSIKSITNIANISYSTDGVTLTAGKQAIDLEWIADYHEAVTAVVTTLPNTTIVLGHTERVNTSANDGALEEFSDIGTKGKGANVIDVAYQVSDELSLGAYYMNAPDTFDAYGVKVEASVAGIGVVGKYASTSEDALNLDDNGDKIKDGSIMALDLAYSIDTISLGGGYITTDKDGIGSISTLGDNINPLDSDAKVYKADAKTIYASVGTSVAGFDLGAIYGATDYESNKKEKELNLSASWECKFVKNLNVSLLYVDIAAQASTDDSSYYSAQLAYSF